MKYSLLLFFGLALLAACNPDATPKEIIEHKKMAAVLTDIHLIDSYISRLPQTDTLRQKAPLYYNAVYKKYQTSKSQFDKSLKYYSERPKLLDSIYSQVLTEMEKKEKKRSKHKVSIKKHDLPK
jgi:Domain of unknown function (DUF4296)